jgi:hypothetical protein
MFWKEALAATEYIRNRLPSNSNPDKASPHQLWYGDPRRIEHIRPFGCLVFAHFDDEQRTNKNFSDKGRKTYLVGYISEYMYLVYDPVAKTVRKTRDFIIMEDRFFLSSVFTTTYVRDQFIPDTILQQPIYDLIAEEEPEENHSQNLGTFPNAAHVDNLPNVGTYPHNYGTLPNAVRTGNPPNIGRNDTLPNIVHNDTYTNVVTLSGEVTVVVQPAGDVPERDESEVAPNQALRGQDLELGINQNRSSNDQDLDKPDASTGMVDVGNDKPAADEPVTIPVIPTTSRPRRSQKPSIKVRENHETIRAQVNVTMSEISANPTSYEQALRSHHYQYWNEATESEIQAMYRLRCLGTLRSPI